MQQSALTSGPGKISTPGDAVSFVCLLEEQLQGYRELARSVIEFRKSCIRGDLQGMLSAIQTQTFLCDRLQNMESKIRSLPRGQAFHDSAGRREELLGEITSLKVCVSGMNRVNARILAKASQNNAILQNVFASALIYGDPRAAVATQGRGLGR